MQRSGIPYTIVRPGGLLNAPRQGQAAAGVIMEGPGTFGLPPKRTPGSILRSQVPCTAMTWHGVVNVVTSQSAQCCPVRTTASLRAFGMWQTFLVQAVLGAL